MPTPSASPPTNRIVVVGAGAAGVFTAYRIKEMYADKYEVVLVEASDRVGGNCFTTLVEYGDKPYTIDCGAQFFYKNPQASYVELIEQLGLMDLQSEIISAPAGFTIWDRVANKHRMWMPSRLSGFLEYDDADWDRLVKLGLYLGYAAFLDRANPANWALSLDDWLATLGLLDDEFKQNVIIPFLYQFCSLPLARMGEASAMYAVTYFVRNVFGEPKVGEPDPNTKDLPGLPVFETYQSLIGLDGILDRVLAAACVVPQLNTPVTSVAKIGDRIFVYTAGGPIACDHVVLTCDPNTSAAILAAGGTSPQELVDTLAQLEYVPLPISIQQGGACWMPDDPEYWEPVNTIVDGESVTFSCWFGALRPTYGLDQRIPVFKSWGVPAVADCPHELLAHQHQILLPTTKFVGLRDAVREFQGKDGVWFAGGWTTWFDSQEAALDSATWVADRLPAPALPATGPARMIPANPIRTERNLRRWLERVARQAPDRYRDAIAHSIEEVATRG
jgi:predicted NAD/FAD-binding protein